MIEDGASSLIGLPSSELEILSSLANAPWYSIRSVQAHMRLAEKSYRVTELLIRADRTVCLESVEDFLPDGTGEVLRLRAREPGLSEFSATDAEPLIFTGDTGLLTPLEILPRAEQVRLLWSSSEYSTGKRSGHSYKSVTTANGLVITGQRGSVLVCQDELPTWLRIDWNPATVKKALSAAVRVESL